MSEHVAELLKPARTPLMSLMGCDIHVINPEWMPHAPNASCIVIFYRYRVSATQTAGQSGEMNVQHMKLYMLCPFLNICSVIKPYHWWLV